MLSRTALALILVALTWLPAHTARRTVQGGDQFLDGIGETSLVARYMLAGSAEDSSRNQWHARLEGGGSFVDDPQFGRALLLTGNGSYLSLPGNALAGEDTISLTAWIFLPTGASGPVFDFGQSASRRVHATISREGFKTMVVLDGAAGGETATTSVAENQWVHLAVVLDPGTRTLKAYLDGARVAQAAHIAVNVAQVIDQASAGSNRLFIGRSQEDAAPTLHARLLYGRDDHHGAEALFKALGRALDCAVRVDSRRQNLIPSTKGSLT